MARNSLYLDGFSHKNPIPAACRIGPLMMSGLVTGLNPDTGVLAPTLAGQCRFLFVHVESLMRVAGGSLDDIVKMTVWMKDRAQRRPLNEEWLRLFPDPANRPAREALHAPELGGGVLIQCNITAWIGSKSNSGMAADGFEPGME